MFVLVDDDLDRRMFFAIDDFAALAERLPAVVAAIHAAPAFFDEVIDHVHEAVREPGRNVAASDP